MTRVENAITTRDAKYIDSINHWVGIFTEMEPKIVDTDKLITYENLKEMVVKMLVGRLNKENTVKMLQEIQKELH